MSLVCSYTATRRPKLLKPIFPMIKITTPAPNANPASKPFPSPPLIVMSVLSCFLATAAFVSSFTQVDTSWAYFIVPATIGFIATVPYHVHLYNSAQEHRRSSTHSDPIFLTPIWIIYGFLLISLWAVIFIINVFFCVGTRAPAGVVTTTIWSGIEWIVLLFIAMKCIRDIWRAEHSDASIAESQSSIAQGSDEITPNVPRKYKPRSVYFISFVLCTLTLVFGIDISVVCLFNVIIFFLTAPHHIALYISYVRPLSPPTFLSRPTSVPCAFFLAALWCGVFILDILVSPFLFQSILLGIFGGMECIIVAYLAIRSVLDSFADGQIKL
ncbi:hypothetical protein FPV67DRAFT_1783384 [Lyophyllum atratum]|nr:hypothetical protein FPV67DRAFT_1783384 [Lyophyllum atratum]